MLFCNVNLVTVGSGRPVLYVHVYMKLHLRVSVKLSCSEPVLQGTINLCGAYSLPASVAVCQGCGDASVLSTCSYPHTFVILFRLRSLVWRASRWWLIVEVRRVCYLFALAVVSAIGVPRHRALSPSFVCWMSPSPSV
jgi:hypothetical protein